MLYEVAALAERMMKELEANAHKGDFRNKMDVRDLFYEAATHQAKLIAAMKSGDRDAIAEHTADMCNIYLMLAMAYGCFRHKADASPPPTTYCEWSY